MKPENQKLLTQLATLGDVTVTNYISSENHHTILLNTQAEAVIYFLQRLDIHMIELILEDNRTYQNYEKPFFIKELEDSLNEFLESGDTFLNIYSGACKSKECNYKCKGYSFIGNKSNNYFDLIFEIKNGVIEDMRECLNFKCDNKQILKRLRIDIDKTRISF